MASEEHFSFHDIIIRELNLDDFIQFSELVIVHFCGKSYYSQFFNDEDYVKKYIDLFLGENSINLLKSFIEHFQKTESGVDCCQINELLLLLNQDRISDGFHSYFFGKDKINLRDFIIGIEKFRGYAMLKFGNIRIAFDSLRLLSKDEIYEYLKPFSIPREKIENDMKNRSEMLQNIETIPATRTWLLGETTGERIERELDLNRSYYSDKDIAIYEGYIDESKKYIEVGLRNNDVYLSWDYMDVYIATSMREKSEYISVHNFIQEVFSYKDLQSLKIRYFDPTQAKCESRYDKGISEGLMLKRVLCSIYMVQENDTTGKDSELATTLAQGKPVIAYVPKEDDLEKFAKKISDYSLDNISKRIDVLQAEGIFKTEQFQSRKDDIKELLETFNDNLDSRGVDVTEVLIDNENNFKNQMSGFSEITKLLAELEAYNYDKRAKIMKEKHPLSIQINLSTGVANGVLIARKIEDCQRLLFRILTNTLKFHIIYDDKNKATILQEDISKCPFRIITDNNKLTNSFWNFYLTQNC